MAIAGVTASRAGGGFNAYAAGNKVYNGGSPNPTSGTVDPTGYVQRELNKPSRSGLASAALIRLQQQSNNAGNPVPGTINNNSVVPSAMSAADLQNVQLQGTPIVSSTPVQQITAQGGNPPHMPFPGTEVPPGAIQGGNPPVGSGTPVQINGGGNNSNQPGQVLSPVVKQLNVNDLGQITLPSTQTLSLDSDLVSQAASATQQIQQQLANLQAQQQTVSADYATQARNQVNAEPTLLNQLLNNFAGRGMAFSSGYGQGVTNENDRYMQALDSLFSNSQGKLNDIYQQSLLLPNNLNSMIAALQSTQADRNIQKAGQLQLDQQLAQLLNPDSSTKFVAVNNDVDKQAALAAGVPLNQIRNVPGGTATGVGLLPDAAQDVTYAGKAASGAPTGATTMAGSDRYATEKMLESLGLGTPNPSALPRPAPNPTAGYNHLSTLQGLTPGTALYAVLNGQMTHLSPAQLAALTPGTAIYSK